METLNFTQTIERLGSETIEEFQWKGVRPTETLRSALGSTLDRVAKVQEMETAEHQDFAKFVDEGINLMCDVYNIRFAQEKFKPLYHGKLHAVWTFIHSMRAYIGSVELDAQSRLNREFLYTLCLASLLHEIDDWWNSDTSKEIDSALKTRINEFITEYGISGIDLSRILVLDHFKYPYNEQTQKYLLNEPADPNDTSYNPYIAQKNEVLYLGKNPDPSIVRSFETCGKCFAGGDFVQCLDLEYLETIPVSTNECDEKGIELILQIPKGVVCLAIEFYLLKPDALKSCGNGWGDKDGIDWFRVGSDPAFLQVFFKHYGPIGHAYFHYYDTEDRKYNIANNMKFFYGAIQETIERRGKYEDFTMKFIPQTLSSST